MLRPHVASKWRPSQVCPHTVLYGGKGMAERGSLLLAAVYASYIEVLYNFCSF